MPPYDNPPPPRLLDVTVQRYARGGGCISFRAYGHTHIFVLHDDSAESVLQLGWALLRTAQGCDIPLSLQQCIAVLRAYRHAPSVFVEGD